MTPYAAVVLAGGSARRLGGLAKPTLVLGGRTILQRVLDAVPDAMPRIVVGPAAAPGVLAVREEPPGGGPVAALAAGLRLVPHTAEQVAVLAADLPFVTPSVIAALRTAALGVDGALLVDADGRDQLLLGVWRTPALRAAVAAVDEPRGARLHHTMTGLDVVRVSWEVPPGNPPPWWDCDDAEDLRRAEEWVARE